MQSTDHNYSANTRPVRHTGTYANSSAYGVTNAYAHFDTHTYRDSNPRRDSDGAANGAACSRNSSLSLPRAGEP